MLVLFFLMLSEFCFAQGDTKILINTLPKSGSVYIWSTMCQTLGPFGYQPHRISQSKFPNDLVISGQILNFDYFVSQEHIDASRHNLKMLKYCLPKFLLHLRDPRQVLLSWLHYIESHYTPHLWSGNITPPNEYFGYPFEKKIDWQIEHFLPALVHWIQQWEKSIDSGEFEILVTTYEEMLIDQEAFFRKIFTFFNFTPEDLTIPLLSKDSLNEKHHFRLGKIDEWKTVMSQKQIDRMHEIIPMELLKRFGWE